MVSSNERDAIKRLSVEAKAKVLALYLIGSGGNTYTMEEVAQKLYKNPEQSRHVSMICRAYGFQGRNNRGRYHPGSSVCRELGRNVTLNDFMRFVAKYPNGISSENENFDHFLGITGYGVQSGFRYQQMQPESYYSRPEKSQRRETKKQDGRLNQKKQQSEKAYTRLDNPQQWGNEDWYNSRSKIEFDDESDTYNNDNETHSSPFDLENVTLPSALGGIAFFAMFWHAAKFYFRAGNPLSWSIIAGLIAIFGGLFIFFRMYKNNG